MFCMALEFIHLYHIPFDNQQKGPFHFSLLLTFVSAFQQSFYFNIFWVMHRKSKYRSDNAFMENLALVNLSATTAIVASTQFSYFLAVIFYACLDPLSYFLLSDPTLYLSCKPFY